MSDHYYNPGDLAKFSEIGKNAPELAQKFFDYYQAYANCTGTGNEYCYPYQEITLADVCGSQR